MTRPFDLEAHLRRIGAWDEPGQRRRAAAQRHACGATVLSGLDAHRCARPVLADPHPVDTAGELAAVLTGRATYDLRWAGDHYELDHRDDFDMRRPPGTPGHAGRPHEVLAEHRCGAPLSSAPLDPDAVRRTDYTAPPPY